MGFDKTQMASDLKTLFESDPATREDGANGIADAVVDNYTGDAASGTIGHIAYWDTVDSITGEANFFWDATNDRLGVGTNSPDTKIHVFGGDNTGLDYIKLESYLPGIEFLDRSDAGAQGNFLLNVDGGYFNIKYDAGEDGTYEGTSISINNTGDIGLGATATTAFKLLVNGEKGSGYIAKFINDGNNANRYGVRIDAGEDTPAADITHIGFFDGDGSYLGAIIYDFSAGVMDLVTASDEQIKENIALSSIKAESIISAINISEYTISRTGKTIRSGFIAQNCEQAYPEMVVDSAGGSGIKSVAPMALIPVLVKAVQELSAKIAALEAIVVDK